jgi:hypothetical protein
MEYQNIKLDNYIFLMDNYIEIILKLIDFSYQQNLLPFRLILAINYIKKYIIENRIEILSNGLNYLLENKDIILNFDLNKLDDLDEDSDDNISRKECVKNINNFKNTYNNSFNESELLNYIIEIKNNSKKLSENNIKLVKKYFEIIIDILEKIKNIFD